MDAVVLTLTAGLALGATGSSIQELVLRTGLVSGVIGITLGLVLVLKRGQG